MYVNTGGVGKTQQPQQQLQNQANVSVRHNNPYPQSHTQQQPYYEHHQGQVTFVYPYCNVAPATHGNAGSNNVAVGGGQGGHVVFQAQHQPQSQPHPQQQQIGMHSTEQALHYFSKRTPMPAHPMHHPPQQHTQIRNMIATVNHQQQSYVVSPNYLALSHALLPQQTRASILTNAASQHAVAAASGSAMATQIQNTAPRNVPPNGPTAYVSPPYCNPPFILGAPSTGVAPQPGSLLTTATGIVQPPSLQSYAHISAGIPAAPAPSTPINIQHVNVGSGTISNPEHNTPMNTNTNSITIAKPRKHAIPVINPDTMMIVPLVDAQPKPQPQTQIQTIIETNMESVSMQTDNDKSLVDSLASDPSHIMPPTSCSNSSSTIESDKVNIEMENEEYNYDFNRQTSEIAIETTTLISVPEANIKTQSLQSGTESNKNCPYEDPNDTDADTNEHELDNEDVIDTTDRSLSVVCIKPDFSSNLSHEQEEIDQIEEVPKTDHIALQTGESDTEHTTETEIKSKDDPCTISVQTSLDRNDEEKSKEVEEHEDLQPSTAAFIVSEPRRNKKNKKNAKNRERNQRNSKQQQQQQQNKSNSASIQKDENSNSNTNAKTVTGTNNKAFESKSKKNITNLTKKVYLKPTFIRYTLEELKALSKSSESCKPPLVPCEKGDCIAQLFVAPQQHHHLSHQGQNVAAVNLQHHVPQSYHQMNFNESMEFVSGKRRTVGGVGAIARKHQEHHINLASAGNNNNPPLPTDSAQKKMQVIRINLSLNEEIKLSECKNAWQPKFFAGNANNNPSATDSGKNGNDDIEDVVKKVRGILNKLTSENFDVLLKEMTSITINTPEKMQKIMLLIFEKTISEPNFAPTYAKFCKVLFEEIKAENKEVFSNLLIKRLEKEFESNVNNADAKERKLQQIIKKLNDTTDPQEKIELQAELEHQEYQFRRRAWGTVRFIGEMFKLRTLTPSRVFTCVESLLEHGNEEKLEYMCKLLTTVGHLLENNDPKSFNNERMSKIFGKMQAIIKEAKEPGKKKIKICSRVRFMMQDLIDLRSKNWGQTSYAQSSHVPLRRRLPEDKNSNLPPASVNSYDRGSSQRMSFGNNNRQNSMRTKESGASGNSGNSSNYYVQKSSKSHYLGGQREQQSIDLKKLNFSRGDDSSPANTKLGTSSAYMWRTITGRNTTPSNDLQQHDRISPTPSHKYPQKHQQQLQQQTQYWGVKNSNSSSSTKSIIESCSRKDNQQLLNNLMEEYLDSLSSRSNQWREEVLSIWQKTNTKQQICLIYYILMDYLHLSDVNRLEKNACSNMFIYLMTTNAFNKTTLTRAYEQFSEDFPDLLTDVPNGWAYVFQFLGPLLHEHLITFDEIWYQNWRNDQQFTERFVIALVNYFTKEFGSNYMRDLWHKEFKLERGQLFKSDHQQWRQFVVANKLQFLYDSKSKPEIASTNTTSNNDTITDQHVQRLEILLSSPNDSNLALDYISTNVHINSYFLRKLTRFLCCDYATTTKAMLSGTSRTSSATTSKTSSTCSNTSSSSNTKNLDLSNDSYLDTNTFRNNCLPLLRLCLDGHEDHELACLDAVVEGIQQEYNANIAYKLIRGIFDVLYDCEVIAKESFEKWYKKRLSEQKESKMQIKGQLCLDLKSYMQNLL